MQTRRRDPVPSRRSWSTSSPPDESQRTCEYSKMLLFGFGRLIYGTSPSSLLFLLQLTSWSCLLLSDGPANQRCVCPVRGQIPCQKCVSPNKQTNKHTQHLPNTVLTCSSRMGSRAARAWVWLELRQLERQGQDGQSDYQCTHCDAKCVSPYYSTGWQRKKKERKNWLL